MINLEINKCDEIIENAKEKYSIINIGLLPLPVQKMLLYPVGGEDYKVIKFLVSYLSYNLGWSLEKVSKLMTLFYSMQEPLMVETSFNNFILNAYKEYHNKYYSYSYFNLHLIYGRIDFESPKNGKIRIPNVLIDNIGEISDSAISIYLVMLISNKIKETWSKDELAEAAGICKRTIDRNVQALIKYKLVGVGNKTEENDSDKFRIIDRSNSCNGVTIVNLRTVRKMLLDDRIKNGSLKVFLLLSHLIKYRLLDSKCYDYQREIGEFFNRTVSRVSELTTDLYKNGYIKKRTYYVPRFNEKTGKMKKIRRCNYELVE